MDELFFDRTGVTNIYNEHVWSDENSYMIQYHHQQQQFAISVWA
jgi:hypothetical protein